MAGHGTGGMSGSVQAYHFVGDTLRDGRPVPPDGKWLVHDGPVTLCESGLHASRRPWHALQYAPGETLCLVQIDGIVEEDTDKLVARRRRIVRRVDLTADLWAFARQCARDVLHLWDDAPDVVRRYLETGDESIREAAWDAAKEASWAAEWVAEWDAASASRAARAAAGASARVAAREAAWAAATTVAVSARRAAWDAARAAAWDAAREAARAAAWDAARVAAREAARDAQGARFDAICRARLGVEETA